ncbi:hypothetical protein CTRI78_v008593 [Colletotrichum trifolii]|uniref:Uncharacterized protein n=1 Tax=Colletotrichum trifolii TaxID=5466 RepID=A0A4R8QYY3_COLTR|nr:hypothetical protein CTRI78_v008593 [Colletotrichum trifolii]
MDYKPMGCHLMGYPLSHLLQQDNTRNGIATLGTARATTTEMNGLVETSTQGAHSKRDASQTRPKKPDNKESSSSGRPVSTPKTVKAASTASGTPESRRAPPAVVEEENDDEEDWKWDAEMIFKEPEETHPPDPIAKPLPGPEGYHGDIVLPPAWNATYIQSEFVTEDNFVDFSRPIRETEFFQALQYDPAFWKAAPKAKPVKRQPETKDRISTFRSSRLPGFPSLPARPPSPDHRDHRHSSSRKRNWEDTSHDQARTRGSQEVDGRDDRYHKRHRGDSHSGLDNASPQYRRARDEGRSIDRYRSSRSDHRADRSAIEGLHVDEQLDARTSSRGSDGIGARQDSGYYSSRQLPRQDSSTSKRNRAQSPQPQFSGSPLSDRRPPNRRDADQRMRRGSHSSNGGSRPVSRHSMDAPASRGGTEDDSDLSDLEAELLGISTKVKGEKGGKHGDGGASGGFKIRKRTQKADSAWG